MDPPPVVTELVRRLTALGGVTELFAAGFPALGDYRPGVSDIDLVAIVAADLDTTWWETLRGLHEQLEHGPGLGLDLGCTYVAQDRLSDLGRRHPTWTHGRWVERPLSLVVRAELVHHGTAVLGRPPAAVLPAMSRAGVQDAARHELLGYWAVAARRPWWYLDRSFCDLSFTAMARGRHTMSTGELISKTAAIETAAGPVALRSQLRARRRGGLDPSPLLVAAWCAWRDARRTVTAARRRPPATTDD